jgi:hypothetical protein
MTLDQIVAISDIAAAVLSAAAFAFAFYVRSVADAKCEKLKEDYDGKLARAKAEFDGEIKIVTNALYQRINGLGDRLQHVESRLDGAAGREDVHKLSLQLSDLSGDLKVMTAKLASMSENSQITGLAIKRLENHLLKIEG